MFSKACEYGIKSAIFIAQSSMSGRAASLKEVSEAIGSPEADTSKVVQELTRNQIITSIKGRAGGYLIEKPKLEVTKLSAIVMAIDGDAIYKGCGLGLENCNEQKPCSLHNQFKVIREDLRFMIENTLIKTLTLDVKNGLSFLKR